MGREKEGGREGEERISSYGKWRAYQSRKEMDYPELD